MSGCHQERGHRALRKGRFSQPGGIYLVTVVVRRREPLFRDHQAARVVSAILHESHTWGDARNLSWVLMPDHWHALLELGTTTPLSRAMQRSKSLSARAANVSLGRHGDIWAPAYHDRAVRAEEDVIDFARYVVANPVRAGLVKSVRDYPYWNAVWL